jgi:hypothetical protein
MTYNPRKRDKSWHMIQPGLYVDPAGYGHVFPDEIVAELTRRYPEVSWNYETDYALIVHVLRETLRAAGCSGEVQFIQHEREEN